MTLRLIVFDLDGTLIDSRRDLADAANAMLADFHAPPLSESAIGDMVGDGAAVLVARAFEASGLGAAPPDALTRFMAHYAEHLVDHTRAYSGIHELLSALMHRVRLAVLTNKPLAPTHRTLALLDLTRYFDEVIGGDGSHGRKPNPAGLRALMASAGATASETLLVGDSPVDLETARRAGTAICLARYGFGFREKLLSRLEAGDTSVASPAELKTTIESWIGPTP